MVDLNLFLKEYPVNNSKAANDFYAKSGLGPKLSKDILKSAYRKLNMFPDIDLNLVYADFDLPYLPRNPHDQGNALDLISSVTHADYYSSKIVQKSATVQKSTDQGTLDTAVVAEAVETEKVQSINDYKENIHQLSEDDETPIYYDDYTDDSEDDNDDEDENEEITLSPPTPTKVTLNKNLFGSGYIEPIYNANGTRILKYQVEIWHEGLKEHKILNAPDKYMLKTKIRVQFEKWEEIWNKNLNKMRLEKLKQLNGVEASRRTSAAEKTLNEIRDILHASLKEETTVNWNTLLKYPSFKVKAPQTPAAPISSSIPKRPDQSSAEFAPQLNFLTNIIKSKKEKAIEEANERFKNAVLQWENQVKQIEAANNLLEQNFQTSLKKYQTDLRKWEKQKEAYLIQRKAHQQSVLQIKQRYHQLEPDAIKQYCEILLKQSDLPNLIKKEFELEYMAETRLLLIEYMLPHLDDMPRLKEVKYNPTRNEFSEVYLQDSFREKLFDETIYQLILRVIHEEFEADEANAIDAINFNGWVNYINRATGNPETSCIASIQVKKEQFSDIDLRNVEPKVCFKTLKGVGSSKLAGITPIQPILTLNKQDKRFVNSYEVAANIDESVNLASISWEDFEHLIREVFETEFSTNGGEVKVTQASRDGGVDAVAFDPDPIRGGKIVIQAKRYTNTVGVSAVRDLYGTVMNEGATKGILVTTADYGPDAYEFVKNKPLTLLNGGHLLHLLEKHGHKAKIDLKEAKLFNQSRNN